jgi:hypothetical protein
MIEEGTLVQRSLNRRHGERLKPDWLKLKRSDRVVKLAMFVLFVR